MCFTLRSHMSATPPQGGLTQALANNSKLMWIRMKNLKAVLILLGAFSAFYLAVLLFIFFRIFTDPSDSINDWAFFGDFLGGSTGPVFSLVSLFAILYTIGLQTKEMSRASDDQLRANYYSEINAIAVLIEYYKEQESKAADCANRFAGESLGQQAYNEQIDYQDRRRSLESKLEIHYNHIVG